MSYRILIVDDDKANITSTKLYLEAQGYRVDGATSGKSALEMLHKNDSRYALILMDYFMPELNGIETAKAVLALNPDQLITMYSCDDAKDLVKEAMRVGISDYIEKDLPSDRLLERVQGLCEKYERTTKLIEVEPVAPEESKKILGLIGTSSEMAKVKKTIGKYAAENQTVLITGETGTGKEVVAKAIHQLSPRAHNSFIGLNCAAIPENLLESTLFGHEKGSFTGAIRSQVGKFVLANHSTLFLDEIGDLSLDLQVKLLRVLQERMVEPVGSNAPIKVDVRIIAATHKDLELLVREGKFREDLYYRLNVLKIDIPPLRQRKEDIEPLIAHFTEMSNRERGVEMGFERSTLSILTEYPWPGNVRELRHAVESHLIRCPGKTVKTEHLDSKFDKKEKVQTLKGFGEKQRAELKRFIESNLKTAKTSKTTQSEAARKMGITPSKLHYYLQAYGIIAE